MQKHMHYELETLFHHFTGFSSARSGSQQSRQVITDKEVICNAGRARYRLENALNNRYSISNDFYYAVKNLPPAYETNTYKRFIDDWGTVSGVV